MSGPPAARDDRGDLDQARAARTALRGELAGHPPPSLRPASLVSSEPIRPLPGALLAKLEARRQSGLDARQADYPRRERYQTTVVPAAIVGTLAGVAVIVLGVTGHVLATIIAAVVLVACGVGGLLARGWIQADPLRLTTAEQRMLSAAGSWQSRQPWTPATAAGPERALVSVAVEVVQQIAQSPAWRSGYLDGHRLALDLGAELDAIDSQAGQVALARATGGADAEADAAFDSVLDRVVALRLYLDGLNTLTQRVAGADALMHAAPRIAQLTSGQVEGSLAIGDLHRLTDEVTAITASVEATAAEVRRERQ